MFSIILSQVIEKPMRMNDLRELIRVYVHERTPPALPPLTLHKVTGWADLQARGDFSA